MNSLLLLSLLSLLLLAAAAAAVHPAQAKAKATASAAAQTVRRTTARTVQQRPRAPAAKAALGTAAIGPEPNPPVWPASVSVFTPSDPAAKINAVVNNAFKLNGGHEPPNHGQFSPHRFAFMFAPGTYGADVEVPVGYYTQVLGLGASPLDTVFTSPRGVFCQETDFALSGALDTFWRGAENFRHAGDQKWYVGQGMMWAVSQASPIRRLAIDNDLLLFEYEPPIRPAGESSGGYFANSQIGGNVAFGSQQQFFGRDSTVKGAMKNGSWNIVTTGVKGSRPSRCDSTMSPVLITSVDTTPTIADKPFITLDATGTFALNVPALRNNSAGYGWDTPNTVIPFENVYVTQPGDSAALINAKLRVGLHLVVTPGIYELDEPLSVPHTNQVVLGLGLATLVSTNQNALIQVGDVDGVRVAGLLLQAGKPSATGAVAPFLLEWGSSKQPGRGENPGIMSDVFARVGGPDGFASAPVAAETIVVIRRGHVIIDGTWLWRADHTAGATPTYTSNAVQHGLVVDGNDVTAYGLAVEHTEQDLVSWNGERGRTYFYQSELPYGVTQQQFGDPGYVSYRVNMTVQSHAAWGVGVYCYFRDHDVSVRAGVSVPPSLVTSFTNVFSVFLNGHGPGIMHVINDKGDASTMPGQVNYVCQGSPRPGN